jgi:type IV pilus assembly protein PilC
MENAYFGNIIRDIEKKIVSGSSFSQALSFYPKVFSHTFVAMVKSGENVGNLGNAVSGLAEYLENLERMKEKIKGALRYPVFILCFMILIVSAIVVFIIPKFNVLFKNARVALPLLTRVVVGISEFIIKHAVISFGFLLLVAITFRYLLRSPKIRLFFDQIKLEIPFVGKIIRKNIIARFSHALGMLLAGEVGVISALSISNEIISNVYFKQIVENIKKGVSAGFSLSESLGGYKIMPRVLIKMVEVGEKTGGLDSMLKASARYYDEEIESTIDNLSTMIEPVFIAVIGFMVLVVALALYLPIFKLSMTVR